jgi:hypothetical protein
MRVVDEFEAGFGWQPEDPEFLERTSHAVLSVGKVWLFDVIDVPGLDERVRALGEPAGVVQLLDRHGRDCATVAQRLGVPHQLTPRATGGPFSAVEVVWMQRWHEVAVVFAQERVLMVGDAVGTASYFRAPGERLGVHPLLRAWPPKKLLSGEPPLHLLCGHGEGIHGESAAEALHEAVETARRRIPNWLPASIRAWRNRDH